MYKYFIVFFENILKKIFLNKYYVNLSYYIVSEVFLGNIYL